MNQNTTPLPHSLYQNYLDQVPSGNIIDLLKKQQLLVNKIFQSMSDDKALYRYAPDKWIIKEVFGHMVDTERVFSYRALSIARNEKNPLPGFEQDEYVKNANFEDQTVQELLEQFNLARKSFIMFYQTLTTEAMQNIGIASNTHVSPQLIARIIFGHTSHHLNVLKERYHITMPE